MAEAPTDPDSFLDCSQCFFAPSQIPEVIAKINQPCCASATVAVRLVD